MVEYMKNNNNRVKKALFVQYSGVNVRSAIRALWGSTSAEIELHILSEDSKYLVGAHQKDRIITSQKELRIELPDAHKNPRLSLYQYDAPGSPRIIMLDNKMIAFGSFVYQTRNRDGVTALDVWGGDIPSALLRHTDPDFAVMHRLVVKMVKDWKDNGITRHVRTLDRDKRIVAEGEL
jgi:hypothetical protein